MSGRRIRAGKAATRAAGSGRRAGQRFDAQNGVVTEGLIFLGDLDPETVGPGIAFATHYEPTPVRDAERLLDALPLRPETTTFVDIGAGMGRVLLLAARRGYRHLVGVEISPALVQIARENVATALGNDAKRVRLVRADASTFALPRGDLVLYLYNPFRAEVLAPLLERTLACGGRAELVIAYHTPLERVAIESSGAFETICDLGFAVVYRLSRPASSPSDSDRRGPR